MGDNDRCAAGTGIRAVGGGAQADEVPIVKVMDKGLKYFIYKSQDDNAVQ